MDGQPLPEIVSTPGGESLRLGASWLLSSRAPRQACERAASSFQPLERSLVICPSPLLGYGIDIILSRLPPSSLLLCVEAEKSLLELSVGRMERKEPSQARLRLCGIPKSEELAAILDGEGPFRRVQYLELTGGAALHREAYARLRLLAEEEIRQRWENRATLWKLGKLWLRNLIKNLPALHSAISPLELFQGAFGRAILVAGAGPSLETALPWARDYRAELFILAVDSALPVLSEAGIKPDAVLCLEAQVHNLADFIGMAGSGITLVADMVSHPDSLIALGGPFCPLSSDFACLSLLSRLRSAGILPPAFPALGSVGVAACAFALMHGPAESPVYITGLDFAYLSGKTHARGSPSIRSWLARRGRLSVNRPWAASMGSRSRVLEPQPGGSALPWRSDSVLLGYARLCAQVLSPHAGRCFDLRPGGIDLGLKRVTVTLPPLTRATPKPADPSWSPPLPEAIQTALSTELALLCRLREGLAGKQSLAENELLALLKDCDYLFCHFPDAEEGPRLDLDFLKRVAIEAQGMMPRWERALAGNSINP